MNETRSKTLELSTCVNSDHPTCRKLNGSNVVEELQKMRRVKVRNQVSIDTSPALYPLTFRVNNLVLVIAAAETTAERKKAMGKTDSKGRTILCCVLL